MRTHKDLILGRAEIVGITGRLCRVMIISGRTAGTFHRLAVSDVRLEKVGIAEEGRLVIRTDRAPNAIADLAVRCASGYRSRDRSALRLSDQNDWHAGPRPQPHRQNIVGLLACGSVPATAATLLLISHFDITGSTASAVISNLLGAMLLLTALSLVFRRQFLAFAETRLVAVTPRRTTLLTVLTGAVLGVLVTISSVGAGAIGVTILLLLYSRLPMAIIVGSDIAHAVPLTLVAGVGHWFLGSVEWPLLTSLLTGSVPGVIIGSYLAARVPDAILRPILAATLVLVSGRLVF